MLIRQPRNDPPNHLGQHQASSCCPQMCYLRHDLLPEAISTYRSLQLLVKVKQQQVPRLPRNARVAPDQPLRLKRSGTAAVLIYTQV